MDKPNNPIELIVCAIATQENNPGSNPGNLRYAGQENARRPDGYLGAVRPEEPIAVFTTRQAGIVALWRDILAKVAKGFTLRQMISIYAPPTENQTKVYVDNVIAWTGLSPNTPVMELIPELVKLNG